MTMNPLDQLHDLLAADFEQVLVLMRTQLASEVSWMQEILSYMSAVPGKSIRPLLLLSVARACGAVSAQAHELAAVVELIHTATLLHDDVVDAASMRRHKATARTIWGNAASVLAGDYLYSGAFELLTQGNSMEIMSILADTTHQIAEGEMFQLSCVGNSRIQETDYLKIITQKTARLYETACRIGVMVSDRPDLSEQAAAYGLHFGIAFQIIDDVLDYMDSEETGKGLCQDLQEGKLTLPIVHALHHANPAEKSVIQSAIDNRNRDHRLSELIAIVRAHHSMQYAIERAKEEMHQAKQHLTILPNHTYRDILMNLSDYVIDRAAQYT